MNKKNILMLFGSLSKWGGMGMVMVCHWLILMSPKSIIIFRRANIMMSENSAIGLNKAYLRHLAWYKHGTINNTKKRMILNHIRTNNKKSLPEAQTMLDIVWTCSC